MRKMKGERGAERQTKQKCTGGIAPGAAVVCEPLCVQSVFWPLTHSRAKQIAMTGPLISHEIFCSFARVSGES